MEPGRVTFDDKMVVRKAIEDAGIPFTYVSANCFAGYFLGGLCQPGHIIPSREHVSILGNGKERGTLILRMVNYYIARSFFSGNLCLIEKKNTFLSLFLRVFDSTAIYVDEDDIAMYTIKTVDDPRTLNKTLYIRPPNNILSQREVVQIWEKLIGKELRKSTISSEEFLACMRGEGLFVFMYFQAKEHIIYTCLFCVHEQKHIRYRSKGNNQ